MPESSHALIIGGTGMLAGVSLHLARSESCVSVVARNPVRMYDLQRRVAAEQRAIHPMLVDYRNRDALVAALDFASGESGPFAQVVSWIHSDAPGAFDVLATHLRRCGSPCDWMHVLGSSGADPRATSWAVPDLPHVRQRHVVLGFKVDNGRSRWLSDEEIADGVIGALKSDQEFSIVGVVEPWSARPP